MNDVPETLRQTFAHYFSYFTARDYEGILDSMYPPLFELIPRSTFLPLFRQQLDDENLSVANPQILNIYPEIRVKQTRYQLLRYCFEMRIDGEYDGFIEALMIGQHGKKHVQYDDEKQQFRVLAHAQLYAIRDASRFSGWKFLEKKDAMMPILEQLLPNEVLFPAL